MEAASPHSDSEPKRRAASPTRVRPKPLLRVVVVGAGLGGLALARALEEGGGDGVRVVVLEQDESLDAVFIGGDLCVPSAQRVLMALGLAKEHEALSARATRPGCLPQHALRAALAASLRRGTLRCGRRVHGVTRLPDGRLCVSFDGGSECADIAVLASGMASSPLVAPAARPHTAAIGDVRWARGRWWDLGAARIRYGADRALAEGLALGERLTHSRHHAVTCGGLAAAAALGGWAPRRWRATTRPTSPQACLGALAVLAATVGSAGVLLSGVAG